MNELQVFTNNEFGELGVIMIDDKPYFPATACARTLGYSNQKDAILRHCRGVVKHDLPHPQNPDKTIGMNFIPEGDLYRLIVRSKLPTAERFERWVFDEVLPGIRKHGVYMTPERVLESLRRPEGLMTLLHVLLDEQQANAALRAQVQELQPKAVFADAVTESEACVSFGEMAKILRQNGLPYGRTRMCEALRRDGFLIRQDCVDYNTPTQWAMERGVFYHCKHVKDTPGGFTATTNVTRVTGKGQQVLLQHFQRKQGGGESIGNHDGI
jgi:anti-repressor protein